VEPVQSAANYGTNAVDSERKKRSRRSVKPTTGSRQKLDLDQSNAGGFRHSTT
jgi:hypothetical protein